jgi:Rab family protein
MNQICRKVVHINVRWSILQRVSVIRQFFRFIWDRILVCSIGKAPGRYRRLSRRSSFLPQEALIEAAGMGLDESSSTCSGYDSDSDLVPLKISLLGDCQIGKTSFVVDMMIEIQVFFFFFFTFFWLIINRLRFL